MPTLSHQRTGANLRDVRAGDEQVACAEVADGARVRHAARPDAQSAHAPQRVRGGAMTCMGMGLGFGRGRGRSRGWGHTEGTASYQLNGYA